MKFDRINNVIQKRNKHIFEVRYPRNDCFFPYLLRRYDSIKIFEDVQSFHQNVTIQTYIALAGTLVVRILKGTL